MIMHILKLNLLLTLEPIDINIYALHKCMYIRVDADTEIDTKLTAANIWHSQSLCHHNMILWNLPDVMWSIRIIQVRYKPISIWATDMFVICIYSYSFADFVSTSAPKFVNMIMVICARKKTLYIVFLSKCKQYAISCTLWYIHHHYDVLCSCCWTGCITLQCGA